MRREEGGSWEGGGRGRRRKLGGWVMFDLRRAKMPRRLTDQQRSLRDQQWGNREQEKQEEEDEEGEEDGVRC